MDQAVTQWINGFARKSQLLDATMIAITQFGVPILVLLVVVQWWSVRDRLHLRHACVAAGASFLVGLGINQIILLFVHRVRPYDAGISHLIIDRSVDWSFPSDHATAAFAIAATFLLQGLGIRGMALLVAAGLVCASRIYVGTHYFTDVIGGALTGVLAAVLIRGVYWKGTRLDRLITQIP